MLENIPNELKQFPHWICWRYEDRGRPKPDKVPYCARTNYPASVSDPQSWSTYDQAVQAWYPGGYDGIGFVLTENDPFTLIDLDNTEGDKVAFDRQVEIYTQAESYTEYSPSVKGLHIVVKGHVPAGRRRSCIEVYSTGRYMTVTGNVYRAAPIQERQNLLNALFQRMGGGAEAYFYDGKAPQKESDDVIIQRATNAVNGDKFKALFEGFWQGNYPSHSDADMALTDIIAFYTQNRIQIERIFRLSALGKRDKALRPDYIARNINKAFDRMLPPVDIEGLSNQLELQLAEEKRQVEAIAAVPPITPELEPMFPGFDAEAKPFFVENLPPGLLGQIAQYVYNSSPRPVREIALATAIGLLAGICGRSFNISGAGLNMYLLLLAPSSIGKETMSRGSSKLMLEVQKSVPSVMQFIGPASIASGQALIKHLSKTSASFVSILGEFGLLLRQLSDYHASSSQLKLREILLQLYNKSGENENFAASIYADTEKNVGTIKAPAFSILGETVPNLFYEQLNDSMVIGGFLGRFTTIECNGWRPELNENHQIYLPEIALVDRLSNLCAQSLALNQGHRVVHVRQDEAAKEFISVLDKFCDRQINGSQDETLRLLWGRVHMKVMKLAALVAIGVNSFDPVVTLEHAKWAHNLIVADTMRMLKKFESGAVGSTSDEVRQVNDLRRQILSYVSCKFEHVEKYAVRRDMHKGRVIPFSYLSRKLGATSAFRNDRIGSTPSLKRAIQNLVENDIVRQLTYEQVSTQFATTTKCYVVSDFEKLKADL